MIYNPYLPSWEYIPDGEPYVYEDRLYVFGSHDRFNGTIFCMNDYVCWSAPVKDLGDWRFEGTIYKKSQDPDAKEESIMQAPDVARGVDGRFYLYYTLGLVPFMAVAVSKSLTGPYEYLGRVQDRNGLPVGIRQGAEIPASLEGRDLFQFDPGIFVDEDGRIFLYSGFSPDAEGEFRAACKKYRLDGAYVMELEPDMHTLKKEPVRMIPGVSKVAGTSFAGHEFYEASSMRKIGGKYYFIYSSILSHELCYAVSDRPDRDFVFGGVLVSNGDIGYQGNTIPQNYMGNTHGSLVNVDGQWYVFYHRQTNRHQYSRQGCAEKIYMDERGHFAQAEITSCGLSRKPMPLVGQYPAYIACNLWSKEGAMTYRNGGTPEAERHPYLTQSGIDREGDGDQYVANMCQGATAGFKYFSPGKLTGAAVWISGDGEGCMELRCASKGGKAAEGEESCRKVAEIAVSVHGGFCKFQEYLHDVVFLEEPTAVYFTYQGTGAVNFHEFAFI